MHPFGRITFVSSVAVLAAILVFQASANSTDIEMSKSLEQDALSAILVDPMLDQIINRQASVDGCVLEVIKSPIRECPVIGPPRAHPKSETIRFSLSNIERIDLDDLGDRGFINFVPDRTLGDFDPVLVETEMCDGSISENRAAVKAGFRLNATSLKRAQSLNFDKILASCEAILSN